MSWSDWPPWLGGKRRYQITIRLPTSVICHLFHALATSITVFRDLWSWTPYWGWDNNSIRAPLSRLQITSSKLYGAICALKVHVELEYCFRFGHTYSLITRSNARQKTTVMCIGLISYFRPWAAHHQFLFLGRMYSLHIWTVRFKNQRCQ